jgi:hypothetical protein
MTLKIFYSDTFIEGFDNTYQVFFPFDLEPDMFVKTYNFQEADVIPLKYVCNYDENINQINKLKEFNYNKKQLLIFMNLWHVDSQNSFFLKNEYNMIDETLLNLFKSQLNTTPCLVHTVKNYNFKNNLIFYDILWNRQKAYFTEYDNYKLQFRLWTNGSTKKCYTLNPIQKQNNDLRKFLCPNRIYYIDGLYDHPRMYFRKKLKEFLDGCSNDGFVSDPMKNQLLEPEENELAQAMHGQNSVGGGSWYPVSNYYYERSYLSVFIETLSITNNWYSKHLQLKNWSSDNEHSRSITEKTWDPLIKGHFILPFGYAGLVEDILSYGFKLPDFIDYSYDKEYDDLIRFELFLISLKKLLEIDIKEWNDIYVKHKHILDYNRQLFFNRPFDSLYEKLLPFFNK